MTAISYSMPPQLKAHYRRVRARSGMGCIWGMRLFILPHMLVGIGFLIAMPCVILWALLGTDHNAQVERLWTSRGSKGATNYNVAYAYTTQSGTHRDSATISSYRYDQLQAPDRSLIVRSIGVPPIYFDRPANTPAEIWKHVGFIWLFGLFWNGILSVFVIAIYVGPLLERRLYRFGLPIPGTIVSKRTRSGKSTTHYITYRYTPPDGKTIEKEMTTTADRWQAVQPNQPVTVLYRPEKPSRSTVYEHGGYECLAA